MDSMFLALFNGGRMAEFSPQALVSDLRVIGGMDDFDFEFDSKFELVSDIPLTEQIDLEPNTPVRVNDGLVALLVQGESRYFSTVRVNPVRVGTSSGDHIQLHGNRIANDGTISEPSAPEDSSSVSLTFHNDKLSILQGESIYLNGKKVSVGDHPLSPGDSIWVGTIKIIPHNGYIECVGVDLDTEAAIDADTDSSSSLGIGYTINLNISPAPPTPYAGFPDYKRSPRIIKRLPTEDAEIKSPQKKEEKKKWEILKVVLPPVMMSGVMVGGSMLLGRGLFVLISAAAMFVSVVFSTTMLISDRKERKKKQAEREENYDKYLLEKRKIIYDLYEANRESLLYHNLSPKEIEQEILSYSSRIYERAANDSDFLTMSLGYGTLPTSFNVKYEAEGAADDINKDPLTDEMKELGSSYKNIPDMPMVIDLKQSHLGLVGEKVYIHRQLSAIMAQLCFYQSYHDIEVIMLIEEEHRPNFEWTRWYPHLKIKNINVTGLISTENHRDQALGNIAQVLKMRKQKQEEEKKDSRFLPHYVFIIDNPKLIINHSIMEYLQTPSTDLGFSLIYTTHLQANLPENIKTVFLLMGGEHGILVMNEGNLLNTHATLPSLEGVNLEAMSRKIAPLRHSQGISTQIPESVSFFELYNVKRPEEIPVLSLWEKNACHKSLAVPLGLRGKDDIVSLNLHEKAHGPHGLVAGTTGSGKSEIVQSYILSLAVNFHPHEVGFLLIDYKGGGMANLFAKLPHLLGTITNLDGSESMRALASIKSELARRQRIFNEHNVNNINQYTKLFKAGEATLPMPHLFIISDEFAELKKEQPDFMAELVSTARIGRSLGVHLILATQKPTGVVDDQIWSNSKFKLALKVANEGDSNEVLKTPDAARITQPGRAYLQVGNNEIYELFQSAYSGAPYSEDVVERGFDNRVYMINRLGQGVLLNEDLSLVDTAEDSRLTQLDVTVNHIHDLHNQLGSVSVDRPWLPPLPDKIVAKSALARFMYKGKTEDRLEDRAKGIADDITEGRIKDRAENTAGNIMPGQNQPLSLDVGTINTTNLTIPLGMVDIPEEQRQTEYSHSFTEDGNLAVFAASGFGKSTVLMNVALNLASVNSPRLLNYFILDYGNSALAQLRGLPHTADYLSIDDGEKLDKLEKLLAEELKKRKQLFASVNAINFKMYNEIMQDRWDKQNGRGGVGNRGEQNDLDIQSSQSNQATPDKLPAIIVFVDNCDIVREVSESLEDTLTKLSRDGASVGVYVVIAASRPGAVRYSVMNNFKNKLALFMYDASDITTLVGRSAYQLPEMRGRAMVKLKDVHVAQLYLPVEYEDEMSYVKLIGETIADIDMHNTAPKAVGVRIVPDVITFTDLAPYIMVKDRMGILGFDVESTEPTYLDMSITTQMIVGGPATGKTNILKLLIKQYVDFNNNIGSINADGMGYGSDDTINGDNGENDSIITGDNRGNGDIIAGETNPANLCFISDSRAYDLQDYEDIPSITYMGTESQLENFYNKLLEETQCRSTLLEESGQRIKDFLASLSTALVLIDDGDNFVEMCKAKSMEMDMEKLIIKSKEMGITFITTTLPSKLRGYDGITTILKDNQAGLVLGSPGDQGIFSITAPRGYKAVPDIGFWFKRGDVRQVKLPLV